MKLDAILTAMIEEIVAAVASGNKVTFVGFGSFEPRERQARRLQKISCYQ